jgi:hypothetical protein
MLIGIDFFDRPMELCHVVQERLAKKPRLAAGCGALRQQTIALTANSAGPYACHSAIQPQGTVRDRRAAEARQKPFRKSQDLASPAFTIHLPAVLETGEVQQTCRPLTCLEA